MRDIYIYIISYHMQCNAIYWICICYATNIEHKHKHTHVSVSDHSPLQLHLFLPLTFTLIFIFLIAHCCEMTPTIHFIDLFFSSSQFIQFNTTLLFVLPIPNFIYLSRYLPTYTICTLYIILFIFINVLLMYWLSQFQYFQN